MRAFFWSQRARIDHWYPAVLAGAISGALFLFVGETPLLRAAALSLVITGVAVALRRLGALYAVGGGVVLALTPVYWSQTGGGPTLNGWLVLIFIGMAGGGAALLLTLSKRLFLSVALGVSAFVVLYLVFGITQKSLRLTTILAAWLIYLTLVALRQTNPRPDEPPAVPLRRRHVLGMLLMLLLGVLNDPLFTLFGPAMVLGLWLSHARLPLWYWLVVFGVMLFGAYRMGGVYISADWSQRAAVDVIASGRAVPYIVWDAWREPSRWLDLTAFVRAQVGWVGIALGVAGIARMSRWYPTLGVVLMLMYSCYGLFGLAYFGGDRDILLLPLLMIHIICATYAVYVLAEWVRRAVPLAAILFERRLFWQTSPK